MDFFFFFFWKRRARVFITFFKASLTLPKLKAAPLESPWRFRSPQPRHTMHSKPLPGWKTSEQVEDPESSRAELPLSRPGPGTTGVSAGATASGTLASGLFPLNLDSVLWVSPLLSYGSRNPASISGSGVTWFPSLWVAGSWLHSGLSCGVACN